MHDAVIPASSARVKTLADGTLQVVFNVEPMNARSAFGLFGMPGTTVAIAALKDGTNIDTKPKGGPLAKWAAMRCADERFMAFIGAECEDEARDIILSKCSIESRSELDNNACAAEIFKKAFIEPWKTFCNGSGQA